VFDEMGSDPAVGRHFPFDRGELNAALMHLCFRLANALQDRNVDLATDLRKEASELGASRAERGSVERTGTPTDLIAKLRTAWASLDETAQNELRSLHGRGIEVTSLLEERILVVTSNPRGESDTAIRLDLEAREIREAFRRSRANKDLHIEHLTAATIDAFRRALLETNT
jgi:hypothetical protein